MIGNYAYLTQTLKLMNTELFLLILILILYTIPGFWMAHTSITIRDHPQKGRFSALFLYPYTFVVENKFPNGDGDEKKSHLPLRKSRFMQRVAFYFAIHALLWPVRLAFNCGFILIIAASLCDDRGCFTSIKDPKKD